MNLLKNKIMNLVKEFNLLKSNIKSEFNLINKKQFLIDLNNIFFSKLGKIH